MGDMSLNERVARALCGASGYNPDEVVGGSGGICADGRAWASGRSYVRWTDFAGRAEAASHAMRAHLWEVHGFAFTDPAALSPSLPSTEQETSR